MWSNWYTSHLFARVLYWHSEALWVLLDQVESVLWVLSRKVGSNEGKSHAHVISLLRYQV
jgi:hypothetical protein